MNRKEKQQNKKKKSDKKQQREEKLAVLLHKIQLKNEMKDLQLALTEPWDD